MALPWRSTISVTLITLAWRNAKRMDECVRTGKVNVIFNSTPVEFRPDSVVLDIKGGLREFPNDFVWIFAGGVPPNGFLGKIGVRFGMQDTTLTTSRESMHASLQRAPDAVHT